LSSNPFYSRVLEGIEGELAMKNFNLVLHLIPNEEKIEMPKMMREKQVDGVILVGVIKQSSMDLLCESDLPMVLVDPKFDQSEYSQVLIDNEHGAFQATQHLIQKGHRRIGFIGGELGRLSFQQRYIGYKKAIEFHHLKWDEALVQTGGLEKGYDHIGQLLKMDDPPTAIFAANDINAIYGYKAISERGLNIPEDVSVVGFDDIALASMSSPPLTTVRVYKEEMGSIAVRNLLLTFEDSSVKSSTTLVPTRLIERESVCEIKE
jgi:LacI family transcriptional regulator